MKLEEFTKFMNNENEQSSYELFNNKGKQSVSDLYSAFADSNFPKVVELYESDEEEYLKVCPHLALLVYFTAMGSAQRTHEVISHYKVLKERTDLPATIITLLENYISLVESGPQEMGFQSTTPEDLLEKAKDPNQTQYVVPVVQALIKNGEDPNLFTQTYREIFGNSQIVGLHKSQLLDFLVRVNANKKIYGDFVMAVSTYEPFTFTISDDSVAEYSPLVIASDMYMSKLPNLSTMVKQSVHNHIVLYHYLHFGRPFPYKSTEEMKVFIYRMAETFCKLFGESVDHLELSSIPYYDNYKEVQSVAENFVYLANM